VEANGFKPRPTPDRAIPPDQARLADRQGESQLDELFGDIEGTMADFPPIGAFGMRGYQGMESPPPGQIRAAGDAESSRRWRPLDIRDISTPIARESRTGTNDGGVAYECMDGELAEAIGEQRRTSVSATAPGRCCSRARIRGASGEPPRRGPLWNNLETHGVAFRQFSARVRDSGIAAGKGTWQPTGARFDTTYRCQIQMYRTT